MLGSVRHHMVWGEHLQLSCAGVQLRISVSGIPKLVVVKDLDVELTITHRLGEFRKPGLSFRGRICGRHVT